MIYHQHFGTKKSKLKFIVTYGISNDRVFTVHEPSSQDVQSNMHKEGLIYHYNKNRHFAPVQTVSENEAGYRKRPTQECQVIEGTIRQSWKSLLEIIQELNQVQYNYQMSSDSRGHQYIQ